MRREELRVLRLAPRNRLRVNERHALHRSFRRRKPSGLRKEHVTRVHIERHLKSERHRYHALVTVKIIFYATAELFASARHDEHTHKLAVRPLQQPPDDARNVPETHASGHDEEHLRICRQTELFACLRPRHLHVILGGDGYAGRDELASRDPLSRELLRKILMRNEEVIGIGLLPERSAGVVGRHCIRPHTGASAYLEPRQRLRREDVRHNDPVISSGVDEEAEASRRKCIRKVHRRFEARRAYHVPRFVYPAEHRGRNRYHLNVRAADKTRGVSAPGERKSIQHITGNTVRLERLLYGVAGRVVSLTGIA